MTRRRGALALAMVVVLAACSSGKTSSSSAGSTTVTTGVRVAVSSTTAAASTTVLANGTEATRDKVPWSAVGPGWTLAVWSPAAGEAAGEQPPAGAPTLADSPETVYLLNPAGGRYAIATLPAPGESFPDLAAWSGDGKRALFTETGASTTAQTSIIELDLTTGATHTFTVPGNVTVQYTRPAGKAVLLRRDAIDTNPASLERVDLTGAHQLTFPASFPGIGAINGDALPSLDGTQLVMSAATGMALVANGGAFIRTLGTSAAGTSCSPVRWWTPDQVLASCLTGSTPRLWLVPTSGAAATALTAVPSGRDLGDMTAWQVPAGTFVQAAGPCGLVYLAKLNADRSTAPVTLPGVDTDKSVFLLGADGGRLALRATVACGGGVSLLWFDPAAGTTNVILGPPVNGGGVINALLYPPSG